LNEYESDWVIPHTLKTLDRSKFTNLQIVNNSNHIRLQFEDHPVGKDSKAKKKLRRNIFFFSRPGSDVLTEYFNSNFEYGMVNPPRIEDFNKIFS
jgi:hypothetical protein